MSAKSITSFVYDLIQEARSRVNSTALRDQFFRIRLTVLVGFLAAITGILGALVLAHLTGAKLAWLTRDPGIINQRGFYVGILSNVGIMILAAATAICFLGAFLLQGLRAYRHTSIFLLSSGAICLMLTSDDAFLLHEQVFPIYLRVPTIVVYLVYFTLAGSYFVYFGERILSTDYLILVLAFLFLGLSLLVDGLISRSNVQTFVEDCLKFAGIVFLLAYYTRTTATAVREALRS